MYLNLPIRWNCYLHCLSPPYADHSGLFPHKWYSNWHPDFLHQISMMTWVSSDYDLECLASVVRFWYVSYHKIAPESLAVLRLLRSKSGWDTWAIFLLVYSETDTSWQTADINPLSKISQETQVPYLLVFAGVQFTRLAKTATFPVDGCRCRHGVMIVIL